MADDADPKVSAAYRDLGRQEPPRALDEAILAASRRPATARAPRWAIPLSLAAVLVLSVVVTLRVQREEPGAEPSQPPAVAPPEPARAPAPVAEAPPPAPKAEALRKAPPRPAAKPETRQEARRDEPKPFADAREERASSGVSGTIAAQAPAPAAAPPPPAEPRPAPKAAEAAPAPQAAASPAPQAMAGALARSASKLPADTPEHELERIAQLRAEGRHDEADRALAEFRKRYPDYRIAEDTLRRVERR